MTTPGGSAPDGAFVLGSAYGQDVTEQSFNALMRGQGTQRGYETAHHGLMAQLGQLLLDVAAGLVQGAISLGGTVIGVVTDIVDGIVNLVRNIAGAILGGGSRAAAAGLPDSFEPGELADIADGQNRLIEDVNALKSNPGFCNVTMSKNWNISGNANVWVPVVFDAQVTAAKNAIPVGDRTPGETGSGKWGFAYPGVLLTAPGVWSIHSTVTLSMPGQYRYFETMIRVSEVAERFEGGVSVKFLEYDVYTDSRWSGFHTHLDWVSQVMHKPLLVPDNIGEDLGDGYVRVGYLVRVLARVRDSVSWSLIGGMQRSSLSVDRFSTDTTDYGAPETATGTGTINAGDL